MIGIDIVETKRIKNLFQKYGERFLKRSFTEKETAYAFSKRRAFESLAGFFALKEAFMKAISKRLPFKEIEVLHSDGKPYILYKGKIFKDVSISHERDWALAVVFLEEDL